MSSGATTKEPETSGGDGQHSVSDKLAVVLRKLEPALAHVATAIEKAQPGLQKAEIEFNKLRKKAEPYHPDLALPACLGLALVVCGGLFPTLILSTEAVRVSGTWPALKASAGALRDNYRGAKDAADKDRADGDAPKNVREQGAIFLKSLNTDVVADAGTKLTLALFVVLATLRVRLSCALTLGAALAAGAERRCGATARDAVARALPEDMRRLAPALVAGALRAAATAAALAAPRAALAAFAAATGAALLVDGALAWLERDGRAAKLPHAVVTRRAELSAAVALAGFAWQCYVGAEFGVLLRLAALPLLLAEWAAALTLSVLA